MECCNVQLSVVVVGYTRAHWRRSVCLAGRPYPTYLHMAFEAGAYTASHAPNSKLIAI